LRLIKEHLKNAQDHKQITEFTPTSFKETNKDFNQPSFPINSKHLTFISSVRVILSGVKLQLS